MVRNLKVRAVALPQVEARALTRLRSVTLKVRAVILPQVEARILDLLLMMSSVWSLDQGSLPKPYTTSEDSLLLQQTCWLASDNLLVK